MRRKKRTEAKDVGTRIALFDFYIMGKSRPERDESLKALITFDKDMLEPAVFLFFRL